ncbi:type IV secretion system protein [uncultured Fusobacterium sp.]|uniref:type IV secretion system protein n=1 Tax=uncultured Fusobacterium sp. TaxID=159267 RepID=UPI0025934A84|nr:type IV secretion system protein [uncultured Fusobacterium sp.]
MDLNILLNIFEVAFKKATLNLTPIALGLLSTFVAFQIVFMLWKKPTSMPFADIFDILVKYWIFYSFIVNYTELVGKVKDTFIFFGMKGAGASGSPSFDPGYLFNRGFNILELIYEKFSVTNPVATLGYAFLWLLGLIIIAFLALNVFVLLLEFMALAHLSVILVPFLIFEKTEFIGAKVFQVLVSQSVQLMVIVFLIELTFGQLDKTVDIKNVYTAATTILGVFGLTYLSWKAPGLASGILNGAPSLNWDTAWADLKSTVKNLKSTGKGAISAGKVAVKTPGAIKDGAKTGYSKGKTAVSKAASFFKGK